MWRREPVLVALTGADAAIIAVLGALMSLDVLSITPEQLAAISAAIVAVTGVVAAVLRASVVSPDTYEHDVLEALWTPTAEVFEAGEAGEDDPAGRIAWGGDV